MPTGTVITYGYLNPANDSVWDVALYANYQCNDKLSFNLRGEYLNQSNLGNGYNGYCILTSMEPTFPISHKLATI